MQNDLTTFERELRADVRALQARKVEAERRARQELAELRQQRAAERQVIFARNAEIRRAAIL